MHRLPLYRTLFLSIYIIIVSFTSNAQAGPLKSCEGYLANLKSREENFLRSNRPLLEKILNELENVSAQNIAQIGGLQRAFQAIALQRTGKAEDFGVLPYDGRSLRKFVIDGSSAYPVVVRFGLAWKKLAALLAPQRTAPLTFGGIDQVLETLKQSSVAVPLLEQVPTSPPAAVVPYVGDEDLLDDEAIRLIEKFLSRQIRLGKVYDKNGIRRGFIDALSGVWNNQTKSSFIKRIDEIGFTQSEHALLTSHSRKAVLRMAKGFRLLMEAIEDPNLAFPLTKDVVIHAIEQFPFEPRFVVLASTSILKASLTESLTPQLLKISPQVEVQARDLGFLSSDLKRSVANWPGIRFSDNGHEWTLLFGFESSGMSDLAVKVLIKDAEIIGFTLPNPGDESRFFAALAIKQGAVTRSESIALSTANGPWNFTLFIPPEVIAKIWVKHRLDISLLTGSTLQVKSIAAGRESDTVDVYLRSPFGGRDIYMVIKRFAANEYRLITMLPLG